MDKTRKMVIAENAVSKVYEWQLGGHQQKVLVEGKRDDLPVVITLHGGPGTPIPFSVGCRGLFPEFTNRFLMVYWDQLGCGCNLYEIDDTFTIDSFVQMTVDLIAQVKKLFPRNKIYLFSMSWGSILSAKVLGRDSHIVDGVVAWGQIVRNIFFNDEVFEALSKSGIPPKQLARIKASDRNHATPKELQLVSSSIRKYTSGYQNKAGEQAPMGKMIKGLLTSPDYRFRDFKAMMVNGYRQNQSLWNEILTLDLSKVLCEVSVPYIILQGDTDIVTSTKNVDKLVKNAKNVNLTCEIVKDSGHMPGVLGMEHALRQLCRLAEVG